MPGLARAPRIRVESDRGVNVGVLVPGNQPDADPKPRGAKPKALPHLRLERQDLGGVGAQGPG